tara:strand:+ start:1324 stop:1599 length:276 start_codon:yes stop_codon:yes gene_type:complete
MEEHNELRIRFVEGYNLTTAEIIYHMPDRPHILQTYIWQDYDIAPKYPVLNSFLQFWEKELDGPLHSILLADQKLIKADEFLHFAGEFTLQ